MKTVVIDLPAMFGDHHVTEVRRLLLEIPGVSDVYASSSFQVAEVSFDEKEASEKALKDVLSEAGYMGELPIEVEKPGSNLGESEDAPFYRNSSAFTQTKLNVSFTQSVPFGGRPLWPCPGMGPLKAETK
jgi:copper chaperone CopZ